MEISAQIGSRKTLLTILGLAAFMVLLQAYLIASLVPVLTHDFQSTDAITGLAVPAYTIPYGLSTLFYGPLSDRLGRKPVLLTLLGLMALSMWEAVGGTLWRHGRWHDFRIYTWRLSKSVNWLAFGVCHLAAAAAVTVLSLGYDMTQPLFAGMVTSMVDHSKRGQDKIFRSNYL